MSVCNCVYACEYVAGAEAKPPAIATVDDAALVTATTILKQSKSEGVPVFKVLDTLKLYDGLQISALVAEILNNDRKSTSTLGYKLANVDAAIQTRNIAA